MCPMLSSLEQRLMGRAGPIASAGLLSGDPPGVCPRPAQCRFHQLTGTWNDPHALDAAESVVVTGCAMRDGGDVARTEPGDGVAPYPGRREECGDRRRYQSCAGSRVVRRADCLGARRLDRSLPGGLPGDHAAGRSLSGLVGVQGTAGGSRWSAGGAGRHDVPFHGDTRWFHPGLFMRPT